MYRPTHIWIEVKRVDRFAEVCEDFMRIYQPSYGEHKCDQMFVWPYRLIPGNVSSKITNIVCNVCV